MTEAQIFTIEQLRDVWVKDGGLAPKTRVTMVELHVDPEPTGQTLAAASESEKLSQDPDGGKPAVVDVVSDKRAARV